MAGEDVFTEWLNKKLGSFDIEDEVMGSYISSIITTDDVESEKVDFLKDVLGDLVQGVDIDKLCSEIMNKWTECHPVSVPENVNKEHLDIGSKVALIMEKQVQPVLKPVNRSTEEEQLREAILTRCTFVSSEEEDCDSDEGATSLQSTAQNQNVEAVIQAEKDRRDKMKSESDNKKAVDKVNKEKQKQKQDERKEKERKRTQKQERRR